MLPLVCALKISQVFDRILVNLGPFFWNHIKKIVFDVALYYDFILSCHRGSARKSRAKKLRCQLEVNGWNAIVNDKLDCQHEETYRRYRVLTLLSPTFSCLEVLWKGRFFSEDFPRPSFCWFWSFPCRHASVKTFSSPPCPHRCHLLLHLIRRDWVLQTPLAGSSQAIFCIFHIQDRTSRTAAKKKTSDWKLKNSNYRNCYL